MDGGSRKRKRSGGQRQRLEEIRAEQALLEQQKDSCLAEHLLYKWAWGEISAQEVQCISKLVLQDVSEKRDLRKLEALAAAGSYGKYSNKVYAAVLKVAAPEIHIPSPFTVKLPFKNPFGLLLQAMILPHILFEHLQELQGHLAEGHLPEHCGCESILERDGGLWQSQLDPRAEEENNFQISLHTFMSPRRRSSSQRDW